MRTITRLFTIAVLIGAAEPRLLEAQCRISAVTGASSTATVRNGTVVSGSVAQTAATDGAYFSITNGGSTSGVFVRSMYSNFVQGGADNSTCNNCDPTDPHVALYGVSFVNPTNAPVTVTRVDLLSDIAQFTPNEAVGIAPLFSPWTVVTTGANARRQIFWTGSISVPARGAQDFIVADTPQNNVDNRNRPLNNTTRTPVITMRVTSAAGTLTTTPFTMTTVTSNGSMASNAVVSFDSGGGTPIPRVYHPAAFNAAPAGTVDIGIRVFETGANDHNSSDIDTPLSLTVTVPAGWSAVSVRPVGAPWVQPPAAAIVQPTATTNGSVTVTTNQRITRGSVTNAGTLVIRATPPASSPTNQYPFRLQLNGRSRGGRTINSFNDSIVQVGTAAPSTTVNAEFASSSIGPGPVRQIDFSTDLSFINGAAGDTVRVQVLNLTTSLWEDVGTVAVSAANSTISRSFRSDFERYVNASNQMSIRYFAQSSSAVTVRIDAIRWSMSIGYTVDNARGLPTNPGNIARPFRAISEATAVLQPSGAVYVDVGNSRTTPYAGNVQILSTQAGTAACRTSLFGVSDASGNKPLIRGLIATPGGDAGIEVLANYTTVDNFEVENTFVALAAANATVVEMTNNHARVSPLGYGVLLSSVTQSRAASNRIESLTGDGTMGIFDASGNGNTIDGNKVRGFSNGGFGGIVVQFGTGVTVQRNILSGNYVGVYFAYTSGSRLWNNTFHSSLSDAVYSEGTTGVLQSRNNIFSSNAVAWAWDGAGTVDSNYDNFFSNVRNYGRNVPASGANNGTFNPQYLQTANPAAADYFRLAPSSGCVNAGTNVGLPFNGPAPDMGAVEN